MLTYMDFRKTNPDYQQLQEDFVDIWGKKGFYLYDHEADCPWCAPWEHAFNDAWYSAKGANVEDLVTNYYREVLPNIINEASLELDNLLDELDEIGCEDDLNTQQAQAVLDKIDKLQAAILDVYHDGNRLGKTGTHLTLAQRIVDLNAYENVHGVVIVLK